MTIYGNSLFGHGAKIATVVLAGTAAQIVRQDDEFVTVVAANGKVAAAGSVVITSSSGAVVQKDTAWSYIKQGKITSAQPADGVGQTVVTIVGEGMLSGGKAIKWVTLAGVAAGHPPRRLLVPRVHQHPNRRPGRVHPLQEG